MAIAIDPQAVGWRDDGSEGGVIQTALSQSGLSIVPFSLSLVSTSSGGSGSYCSASTASLWANWRGEYSSVACGTGAAISAYAQFSFCVSGKTIGLLVVPPAIGLGNVVVLIDGEAYLFPAFALKSFMTGSAIGTAAVPLIIATNLADTLHFVEVIAVGSVAIGAQNYVFTGVLAESRLYGNFPVPVTSQVCGSKVFTVSTEITLATSGYVTIAPIGITCLAFYNYDNSAQSVTIGSATGQIDEKIAIPALSSAVREWTIPLRRSTSSIFLTASAANVIRVTTYGYY